MGNGLYGENQGNESRAAGRGNESVMLAERIDDNALVEGDILKGPYSIGDKLYPAGWKAMFQLKMWDTLKVAVEEVRQWWYGQFLRPQPEEGEEPKKYILRVKKAEEKYRNQVDGRIQSMLTSATVGECRVMRANGQSFKNGWKLRPKRGETVETPQE